MMAAKTRHHQEHILAGHAEITSLDVAQNLSMVLSSRKGPWMYCREYLVMVYALIVVPVILIGRL
jgi:hypothetical protein